MGNIELLSFLLELLRVIFRDSALDRGQGLLCIFDRRLLPKELPLHQALVLYRELLLLVIVEWESSSLLYLLRPSRLTW